MNKNRNVDKMAPVLARGRAVVGIDIGKRKHAAAAISCQGELIAKLDAFGNTREGFDLLEKQVLRKAGGPAKTLVVMEATGHYWICLYHELTQRGYDCVVLNPIQTNARLRSRIRKTKTDPIDSLGIAQLILTGDAKATRVPDEPTVELRLLVRHRWRLVAARSSMERYAHTLIDRVFPEYDGVFSRPFLPSGRALIREVGIAPAEIVSREDEVRDLLRRASRGRLAVETIDQLVQRASQSIGCRQAEAVVTSQLRQVFEYVDTIERQLDSIEDELTGRIALTDTPLTSLGIRAVLAATIHAESDPISDFPGPDQYVAYAGLDPSVRESGDSLRGRSKLSKRGSPLLRRALYLAAFSVTRQHDYFHRRYQKHRRKGRSHQYALVVVAHQLARVIWRMLTDNRPFKKRPPKKG
jgi:transposase